MRKAVVLFLAAAVGCGSTATHDTYLSRQIDNLTLRVRHLEDRLSGIERSTAGLTRMKMGTSDTRDFFGPAESIPTASVSRLEPLDMSTVSLSSSSAGYLASSSTEDRSSRSSKKETTGGDPFTRQVQKALKRAGYNPGPIDGMMGQNTQRAIERFQKARGLKVTGSTTPATWRLLKRYL